MQTSIDAQGVERRRAYNREAMRKRRAAIRADPEKFAAYKAQLKAWREANPRPDTEANKRSKAKHRLAKRYGISLEDYARMLDEQDGVCAICKGVNANGTALGVDHNHALPVGQGNRQLLCHLCNKGLGYYKDRPDLIRRAAEYLRKHCDGCDHG